MDGKIPLDQFMTAEEMDRMRTRGRNPYAGVDVERFQLRQCCGGYTKCPETTCDCCDGEKPEINIIYHER